MKKYYFELRLENKETNYFKCPTFYGVGATLNDARRNLISNLEDNEDIIDYTEKLEEEFIKINNINDAQLKVLKSYFENEKEEIFNIWTMYNNFSFISKVLNRKLKNIDSKTNLKIAIDELAPGYYHDLIVIRHY